MQAVGLVARRCGRHARSDSTVLTDGRSPRPMLGDYSAHFARKSSKCGNCTRFEVEHARTVRLGGNERVTYAQRPVTEHRKEAIPPEEHESRIWAAQEAARLILRLHGDRIPQARLDVHDTAGIRHAGRRRARTETRPAVAPRGKEAARGSHRCAGGGRLRPIRRGYEAPIAPARDIALWKLHGGLRPCPWGNRGRRL